MHPTRLRWGVIGTANIGRSVNPAIHASCNGELAAVASRDAEKARAYAAKWAIPRHCGSYDELLRDTGIDAVYIPLPNGLHKEWTIRAAECGKHILCEKPLALTAGECHEMQRAADANGVKLMEAFMYRFHPRTERVIELVRGGVVGEPRVIRSAFTFNLTRPTDVRFDAALGGGALMDVGCYCVNITRTLAASEPREVRAWATWHASGVDAALTGVLTFDNGIIAHFDCALDVARGEYYEIVGTHSTLRVERAYVPGTGPTSILEYRAQPECVTHDVAGGEQYVNMVEHFADAALNDLPLRYPASEGAANMAVIDALLASARSGGSAVLVRRDSAAPSTRARDH